MQFSVIVPIYNVEKYLTKCLDSIVNQSFEDYEIILVDDGSTDSSGKIADAYKQKYMNRNWVVVHQENQGLAGARNTGLDLAKGDWIVFIDSDDYVVKNMMSILSRYIKDNPAELYSFNSVLVNENEEVISKLIFAPENHKNKLRTSDEKLIFWKEQFMQYKCGWEAWSRVYNRKIIEDNGIRFYNTKEVFAEDYLFSFLYMYHISSYYQICDLLYFYRQQEESLMHTVDYDSVLCRLGKWSRIAYSSIKKERLIKKEYYGLFFFLINYHIQYMLKQVSDNSIREYIVNANFDKIWCKKIQKNRLTFEKYMIHRDWIALL